MTKMKFSIIFYYLVTLGVLFFVFTANFLNFNISDISEILSYNVLLSKFWLLVICLILIILAEIACLIATQFPFSFPGNLTKKERFYKYIDGICIIGRSYEECTKIISKKNYFEKDYYSVKLQSCHQGKEMLFTLVIGEITRSMSFFIKLCSNFLRTISLFIIMFLISSALIYKIGITNIQHILLSYVLTFILTTVYCFLMYVHFYNGSLENIYDTSKAVRVCANCKRIAKFENTKWEYERPDFINGKVESHTTYKQKKIGSINFDDDSSISIYGETEDVTTLTAYGRSKYQDTCEFCGYTSHYDYLDEHKFYYKH